MLFYRCDKFIQTKHNFNLNFFLILFSTFLFCIFFIDFFPLLKYVPSSVLSIPLNSHTFFKINCFIVRKPVSVKKDMRAMARMWEDAVAIINFSSETAETTTKTNKKETCIKILFITNIFFCILKMERNLINALEELEQSNVLCFWREDNMSTS